MRLSLGQLVLRNGDYFEVCGISKDNRSTTIEMIEVFPSDEVRAYTDYALYGS